MRVSVLAVFLFGALGLLVELWLEGHYEGPWQPIPLGLLGVALGVGAACIRGTGRRRHATLRVVTIGLIAAGLLGLLLHYRGNVEFERELSPALRGWGLFREAVGGATPTLAPGALIELGLLGWIYGYRHPASTRGETSPADGRPAVARGE